MATPRGQYEVAIKPFCDRHTVTGVNRGWDKTHITDNHCRTQHDNHRRNMAKIRPALKERATATGTFPQTKMAAVTTKATAAQNSLFNHSHGGTRYQQGGVQITDAGSLSEVGDNAYKRIPAHRGMGK